MSQRPVEDKRFFLQQFIRTAPLNFLSIGIKFLAGLGWTVLDNARILGTFSLASTPSAISQRATIAGAIAQTILPNTSSKEEDAAVIRMAAAIDVSIIAVFILILSTVFALTRAAILQNLGVAAFALVCFLALFEPIASIAVHSCNAKRHYVWNFFMNNVRLIVTIVLIGVFHIARMSSSALGLGIWAASSCAAFAGALAYFFVARINPLSGSAHPVGRSFRESLKKSTHHLIFFKVSLLLFGSLPSFFLAYIKGANEVGLFAFAMTLSGFLFAVVAPINEQVYSPSFSRHVHQNEHRLLVRRLVQMTTITAAATAVCASALLLAGEPLLRLVGKVAFLGSFRFLPVLLLYQFLMLVCGGFTYSLFCMNRYKALSVFQFAGVAGALLWVAGFHESMERMLWCLPISTLILGALSGSYVFHLYRKQTVLLRRSMVVAG